MPMPRVGGIIYLSRNGQLLSAKGEFTLNQGLGKKEVIKGSGRIAGYKEEIQVAFIEGAITDSKETDLKEMMSASNETLTLELANGKTAVLAEAIFTGEGNITTGEGEVAVRWEGTSMEIIP